MKHVKILTSITAFVLLFTLGAFMARAQNDGEEGDPDLQIESSASVPIATAGPGFSYQGVLHNGTNAVSDSCDFQFSLWDGASGGSQVGGTETLGGIIVEEGLFKTTLNSSATFGQNPFTGEERFLQIAVRCPADDEFVTLTQRVPLTPAPYALALPGVYPNGEGLVGIGTSEPIGELHVKSHNGNADVILENQNGTQWDLIARASDDSFGIAALGEGRYLTIKRTGSVGIATENPSGALHVKELAGVGSAMIIDADSGVTPDISFRLDGDFAGRIRLDRVVKEMQFTVKNNNGNEVTALSLSPNLVTVPVLQITGGSDLSEQFDIAESKTGLDPQPGNVVCIDAENPGKLILCDGAYNTTVAGIVSGAGDVASGMVMGHDGTIADGEYPVALVGRVYVMADASNGSIQPGDLLTTSDFPGHAMKVTDHTAAQGAILGKAMTALDEGQGLILVLVTLQ